nr:hypothetical protein F21B7.12 - Arabidopsis thaliana [Arabidopsis thaliana]
MKRGKGEKKATKSRDGSGQVVPLTEPVVTATGMVGTRSWIGGLFTRSNRRQDKAVDYTLSPLQEERLQRLQDRMVVPFDETRPDHQESLKALWNVAFPNVHLTGLVTEQWKEMGWQGPNPSTDFSKAKMSSRNEFPQTLRRRREGIRCTILYSFRDDGCSMACNARFLHGIQFLNNCIYLCVFIRKYYKQLGISWRESFLWMIFIGFKIFLPTISCSNRFFFLLLFS